MQFGLPNVTSTIGAEAMHENFDWNGFITDNETEFVEKAVLLYQDENIWEKSQENGYQIVEKLFKKRFSKEISQQKQFGFQNIYQNIEILIFLGKFFNIILYKVQNTSAMD